MKKTIEIFGKQIEVTDTQLQKLKELLGLKEQRLCELAPGETFSVGRHEFVVLEQSGDTTAAILKDLLHERMAFGGNNNPDGSKVDQACREFSDEIAGIVGKENLVEHTVDLTSDDGLKDYGKIRRRMSLLTAELYRRYSTGTSLLAGVGWQRLTARSRTMILCSFFAWRRPAASAAAAAAATAASAFARFCSLNLLSLNLLSSNDG